MKSMFIILVLVLVSSFAFSQDLIVTNEGDSINCKITQIESDMIYFIFEYEGDVRNTLIQKSEVKEYQYKFYSSEGLSKKSLYLKSDNYQKIRFAVNGGFSYQTARISESVPADFEEYIRDLKSGFHLGADFTFFFNESVGIGLKANLFKTKNSLDGFYISDNMGNVITGTLSDDIAITFIGPSFTARTYNFNKKNALNMTIAAGYMGYRDNQVVIESQKLTGSSVGMGLDIGYDIGISENMAIGFQVSYMIGVLTSINIERNNVVEKIDLEEGEYESMNRLDLSIGLRFIK